MTYHSRIGNAFTRSHSRLNIDMLAYYQIRVKGVYEKQVPLFLKTIGRGGLMFLSPIPLSVGRELQIKISYFSEFIEFTAKGVWTDRVKRSDTSLYKNGAVFTEITLENLRRIDHIIDIHSGNLPIYV